MERFAFKIDKHLKANLYKICRLCGIDNPDKVNILGNPDSIVNVDEGEPELQRKIEVCIGFTISKDDKMPQTMCTLCVDKINDFFEFREMCFATNAQTRKLLGLKEETRKITKPELQEDVKNLLPPHHLKRIIFGKNKRKRKHEELTLKTVSKEDVDIKVEKMSSSGAPIRKKLRFSSPSVNSSPITVASIAAAAIPAAQKKKKPLTPMQRRTLEQSKKDAVKKELRPREDILKKELKTKEDVPKKEDSKSKEDSSKKELKSKEDSSKKELKPKEDLSKKELKPKEEIKDEPLEGALVGNQTLTAVNASNSTSLKVGKLKQCCTICDQRFISKAQLERHMFASHVPNVPRFVCTACNETMKKSNDIKNHQLWHKLSKTPFVCGLCGEHLLSVYAYSKHLRDHTPETPTALLVLDRECPQCQHTFVTNFLYNTHPCSVNTKRCAGCNRLQRNETEYLRHAALCSKVYINYSKHILAAAVAEESCVRIKNENDVEAAAAAEALARSAGTSLDMTPVVSLTRLTAPMLMNANQCVLIPRNIENEETPASRTLKKNNKKGVSKKDLKRVDELLKSTMDTLVSIKHEPEIHMDTDVPLVVENADNDDEVMDAHEVYMADDDFHANDETEEQPSDGITIKQESLDFIDKDEYIKTAENIKKEAQDLPLNKIPVLKLKITKEHGKLNSSLVEETAKSEKKKKKKKRKDVNKGKEKFMENENTAIQDNAESNIIQDRAEDEIIAKLDNLVPSDSILMPQPGIIRIKQEHVDDDLTCPMHASNYNEEDEIMSLVMTSIPQEMDFQISCVSSGVDFTSSTSDNINPAIDSVIASKVEDVKPCLENLELLLQISNVSGGVEISHSELHQKVVLEHRNINKKKSTKPKKTKAPTMTPSTGKALKSTSGAKRNQEKEFSLPRIVAVSSADDIALCGDLGKVIVKKERLDVGYGDEVPLNKEVDNTEHRLAASYPVEGRHDCHKMEEHSVGTKALQDLNEEEAYIASIDFNNIMIKREKDIEVSEVELNESIMNVSFIQNGFESMTNVTKLVSTATTFQDSCSNVDRNEYYQEEEIDEAEEEEDDEEQYDEQDEIEEEREYRELELPPMLGETETEGCSEKTKIDGVLNIDHDLRNGIGQGTELETNECIDKHSTTDCTQSSMTLVITNVVSEANASEITSSNSKNKDIDKTEGVHDIIMDARHDDNGLAESTQLKILSVVSEGSEIDFNRREEYQNISSDVNPALSVCTPNDLSEVRVDSLVTESFRNDSKVLEVLIKDMNITEAFENKAFDINLPVTTHTINGNNTVATGINFVDLESVEINTMKEREVMSSATSSLANALTAKKCSSETVVSLITESDLKNTKNLEIVLGAKRELETASYDSTTVSKYSLEESNVDVVSLIPEYNKTDLNISECSEETGGIQKVYENILVDKSSSAETSNTDIIVSKISKSAERSLKAKPFDEQKPSENIYKTPGNVPTHATGCKLEELQNQLNLEVSEENSIALPSPVLEAVPNFINTTLLPLIQLHPYLEDISSSSSSNFNSSMLLESPTTSSSALVSYQVSVPILNEEAENVVNESTDAVLQQNNINEIAENNNNANIERELNDDSLSSDTEMENEDQEIME